MKPFISGAVMLGTAFASTHFEYISSHIIMYLFLAFVSVYGPRVSRLIVWNGVGVQGCVW